MTTPTPDVPLRLELTFELPGRPEQVWDAIATAKGISAWFMPTDLEEREGGAVRFHMGEDDSAGTVTGWEPPVRFAYVEPDWAQLAGQDPASVSPLATEFLVEAKSGGTCVVRVVTSAFGSGADWEEEFFEEMKKGWMPFFDNLRLYLTQFPGQRATTLSIWTDIPGDVDGVWTKLRDTLGASDVGKPVEANGIAGHVHRIGAPPGQRELLVRLSSPGPGYLGLFAHDAGDGRVLTAVQGYLFFDDASAYVERETPVWRSWLESLATPAA